MRLDPLLFVVLDVVNVDEEGVIFLNEVASDLDIRAERLDA